MRDQGLFFARRAKGTMEKSREISQEAGDGPATLRKPERAAVGRRRLLVGLAALVALAVGIRVAVPFFLGRSRPEIPAVDVVPGAEPEIAALAHEAAEVVEGLIERRPEQADSWDVRGSFYYEFHNLDEAVKCWKRCLELDPGFAEAYYRIGVAARDRGRFKEAVDWFRKALEHAPGEPQVMVHLAQTLMDLGAMEEATGVLEENLAAYPRSLPSFLLLGEIYVQSKQFDKAKKNFETARQMWPDDSTAYYGLVRACAGLGETAESERYRKKFEELKVRVEKAHREFLKSRSDAPRVEKIVSEVYTAASKAYLAQADTETAEKLLLRAVELCPSQPECYQVLAWLYERQGRLEEAQDALLRGSRANPADLGVHLRLGVFLAEQGEFDAAEKALQEAIQLMPYQGGGYAALARLHLTSDRKLPEAKELAARAVELEPLAKNYFLLGLVCQKAGDRAAARAAIEKAVALDPENLEYRRACELVRRGKAE